MDREQRKKFILGMTGYSFFAMVFKAILAGIIQATASFYAKEQWDKWRKRKDGHSEGG